MFNPVVFHSLERRTVRRISIFYTMNLYLNYYCGFLYAEVLQIEQIDTRLCRLRRRRTSGISHWLGAPAIVRRRHIGILFCHRHRHHVTTPLLSLLSHLLCSYFENIYVCFMLKLILCTIMSIHSLHTYSNSYCIHKTHTHTHTSWIHVVPSQLNQ